MGYTLKTQLAKTLFPGRFVRRKYGAFRDLLECDRRGQLALSRLEEMFYDRQQVDFNQVRRIYRDLSRHVTGVIGGLEAMAVPEHAVLMERFSQIEAALTFHLAHPEEDCQPPFTLSLSEVALQSCPSVGGKAANLARAAGAFGLPVPGGFAVTAAACRAFYRANTLRPKIDALLAQLDIHSQRSLNATSQQLRDLVHGGRLPGKLSEALAAACRNLARGAGAALKLAVRSSAVAEDSQHSFAGQYRSLLNVTPGGLCDAYLAVLASKYAPQALYYRIRNGLLDDETDMAVLVLKLIPARASGVLYTRDPLDPGHKGMTLHAIQGFGEPLVGGRVTPAVWRLEDDPGRPLRVVHVQEADQSFRSVLSDSGETCEVPMPSGERRSAVIDEDTAHTLARWGADLESYFGAPQDLEWCQDESGALHLLQCRPLETHAADSALDECRIEDVDNELLLAGGVKASAGVGSGRVRLIRQETGGFGSIPPKTVLVVGTTAPEMAQVADRLSAVVADVGSAAGHFASIAREFGIPMLVNTGTATQVLREGQMVTVFADRALVFAGESEILLRGACGQVEPPADSPFFNRLKAVLDQIAPLNLVEPGTPHFSAENCLTLHDILRFAHERAIQAMFALGDGSARQLKGARRLATPIPLTLYVVDLGRGTPRGGSPGRKVITLEEIENDPLQAVWRGLSHPDIRWSETLRHFDWRAFDSMSGGLVRKDAPELSSYALLSKDYLNLNFRFGYHFVVVDTLCGAEHQANYVYLSFKGGGGLSEKRRLRARFLRDVLDRLQFRVNLEGDLVEGHLRRQPREDTAAKLEKIGSLLGCTRLLDMVLEDEAMVRDLVDEFFKGHYRFGPFAGQAPPSNRA